MTTSQLFPQKNIQHVYFPKTSLNPTPTNPQRKSSNEVNSSKTNPNIPAENPSLSIQHPNPSHAAITRPGFGSGEELLQVTNQPRKYENDMAFDEIPGPMKSGIL